MGGCGDVLLINIFKMDFAAWRPAYLLAAQLEPEPQ